MRINGHLTPEEHGKALGGAALLENATSNHDALIVLRAEDHGHAVIALIRKQVTALLGLLAEEAMRDLEKDARAVAGIMLKALAASMLEVNKHRQRIVDHGVRALTLEVRQRANAARVMLKLTTIQALWPFFLTHGYLPLAFTATLA